MTDNRTNEPKQSETKSNQDFVFTEAQVEAAAKVLMYMFETGYPTMFRDPWHEATDADKGRFRDAATRTLVAAQGAAPQAEGEGLDQLERAVAEATGWDSIADLFDAVRDHLFRPRTQAVEDYTRILMVRLADGLRVALAAPVLPSSTVDEDALAKVVRKAEQSWHLSDEKSQQSYACGAPDLKSKCIARAVAEWLKEQG